MKRILALTVAVLLCVPALCLAENSRFTYTFYGTFDTVIILVGYAPSQEVFDEAAVLCEREFKRLDLLYNPYLHSDIGNNLWMLNNGAWKEPMPVEKDLMDLILFCRRLRAEISDTVNPALGRVLMLWHDARMNAEDDPAHASVPDAETLRQANEHTDLNNVVVDEDAGTVFYTDPKLRLDFGAVAKGYAAGLVADELRALLPSFSINAGGNIVLSGAPENKSGTWKIGIQDPNAPLYGDATTLGWIERTDGAIVTSGDYQRFFVVDGVAYHHIIDPATLQPARSVRAVTVITQDSGIADFLSTACFILPYEESRALIDSLPDTEALWVLTDGSVVSTDGFGLHPAGE
ncbi:MAG: FAD:protein FMN transferase [Clostridia bacterium]|nr:FAD:protein FMN transferase [Clostridia bacterium]